MTHFVEHYGLWVVFVVVIVEVAGLPFIPGETALIAAAALSSQLVSMPRTTIALATTRGRTLRARKFFPGFSRAVLLRRF